jgi:hypothetical protein
MGERLYMGMACGILIGAYLVPQCNVLHCKKIQVSSAQQRSIHIKQ